jgi:hypothetical protein
MPNWCSNIVQITGDNEDLKVIADAKLAFHKLVPRPEGVDWHRWNCDNWGTKWDIVNEPDSDDESDAYSIATSCIDFEFEYDEEAEQIDAEFSTAWSPPIEFFEHLTKKMPSLEVDLKYWEGGCDLCGHCIIKGGEAAELPIKDEKVFVWDYFGYDYEDEDEDEEQDEEAKAVMKLVNEPKLQEPAEKAANSFDGLIDKMMTMTTDERENVFKHFEDGCRKAFQEKTGDVDEILVQANVRVLRQGLKAHERVERGKQLAAQA